VLARPAEMINAWDIMEAVVGKSSEGARVHGNFSCPLHPTCLPQSIRQLVSESFKQYLQDITLDQFSKKKGIV
jgi:DNA-binding IscR family transcriptional regulator